MRFPRICFVRHCEERSDAAISKQMLGMTIYYKPKVYDFEKKIALLGTGMSNFL